MEGARDMPCLMTVTGARIELQPSRCYLFGRTADCDVVVQDMTSSRHHARLSVGANCHPVTIEDLQSRNGTYVNDEKVDGRMVLKTGSRIRIGATLYLLSLADAPAREEEMLDTGTVAVERLSSSRGWDERLVGAMQRDDGANTEFAGQLSSFNMIEILQLLMQTHRSGSLHIQVDDGHAEVEIRQGDVMSATYQDLQGFQALLMLVRKKTGIFWLVETYEPVRKSIHEPASTLLLELCRTWDEREAS